MLDFTKTVSCLVIRTAQQIDTKLFENFHPRRLVKFYFMTDFNSLAHELKQRKVLVSVWGLL